MKKALLDLNLKCLSSARLSGSAKFLLLPTPFSDDAGWLRRGMAAQAVTTLPSGEAAAFGNFVRAHPEQLRTAIFDKTLPAYPQTWRLFHTSGDTLSSLTPENFETMVKFAVGLVG
jgi:hypothetical protein